MNCKNYLNIFNIMKHLNVVSILVLIIGCIYYLVTAVQVMQQILEQLERAQNLEGDSSGPSVLTRQAKALYERHEISLIYQIIICSTTTALSLFGLMATVKEHLILVLIYASITMLSFIANGFLQSKLRPWILVLLAMVSIVSFSFAYAIRRQKTSALLELNLPEVYFNNNQEDEHDEIPVKKQSLA